MIRPQKKRVKRVYSVHLIEFGALLERLIRLSEHNIDAYMAVSHKIQDPRFIRAFNKALDEVEGGDTDEHFQQTGTGD